MDPSIALITALAGISRNRVGKVGADDTAARLPQAETNGPGPLSKRPRRGEPAGLHVLGGNRDHVAVEHALGDKAVQDPGDFLGGLRPAVGALLGQSLKDIRHGDDAARPSPVTTASIGVPVPRAAAAAARALATL